VATAIVLRILFRNDAFMKIITGGQTGVDRAALDAAIAGGLAWGGWCPNGGWAEDFPDPPGLLARYPGLRETPLCDPAQRTEWNVRDSDAILVIADRAGFLVSKGTRGALEWASHYGKPRLVVDVGQLDANAQVAAWLREQCKRFGPDMALGVGGPRESEAPGVYASARRLMASVLCAFGGVPSD
jgi:putative molybdenum carrier protein